MEKKAQGLSIQTIIIAIIVLTVLLILVFVFTNFFGDPFNTGTRDCTVRGGQCIVGGYDDCADAGGAPIRDAICFDTDGDAIEGEVCCTR